MFLSDEEGDGEGPVQVENDGDCTEQDQLERWVSLPMSATSWSAGR
jgi:hypothetical protein